ncbi:MAG TPA: hypothetical protein V6C95_19980 [Coleofasciculaceae cyanobacterium]
MKRAYLIIGETEKLVNADEVEYEDYSRGFKCYECNATLHLRKEHYINGHLVPATFVHEKGDISECSLRVCYDTSSFSKCPLEYIKRGQSSKKHERAFIKCLEHFYIGHSSSILEEYGLEKLDLENKKLHLKHLKRRILYNEIPEEVHPYPDLFINASCAVLKNNRSHKYIEQKISEIQTQLNLEPKAQKYFSGKELAVGEPAENLIKNHFRDLKDIITKFIGGNTTKGIYRGGSDEFRSKFFKIILWGNSVTLPIYDQYLWTDPETNNTIATPIFGGNYNRSVYEHRKKRIKLIQSFKCISLKKICDNPKFLEIVFEDFYQNQKLSESKFIQFILSEVVESIQYYDWSKFPEFYSLI